MYCFGGYDGSYRNDFHEFNFGTPHSTNAEPPARCSADELTQVW
jgi:hypothetical protein